MQYRTLAIDGDFLARSRYEAGGMFAGFILTTLELYHRWKPKVLEVAWDPSLSNGSTLYRKKLTNTYKSNRKKTPDQYIEQKEELKRVLPWFGITQFTSTNLGNNLYAEGDDVLASIASSMLGTTLIWTADKDLLQLVSKTTHVLKAGVGGKEDKLCTPETVKELTGLTANEWTDFLILAGDAADGVPGLSKVGTQRAKAILKACPDIIQLILSNDFDGAREQVLEHDISMTKWIEKAIDEHEQIALTLDLIKLYVIDTERISANTNPVAAGNWLIDSGLDWILRKFDLIGEQAF